MHPPDTRARCSLHLLLVGPDGGCPDPSGLLAVLGDGAATVTVAVWSPDEGPDPATVRRAADVSDDVEQLTGTRPRYCEVGGDLAAAVRCLTGTGPGAHPASGRSIVAVSSGAPRRLVRALRRHVSLAGAHLALLPRRSTPSCGSVTP